MKLESLKKLFVTELKDIYSAETQLVKALPKMAKAASNEELKNAFQTHLEETQEQVQRLEQIFEKLGESPKGHPCEAMKGLIKEGEEVLDASGDADVIDAALIAAAQKVEHYEIASYGTVAAYAKMLEEQECLDLLLETLEQEKTTDQKLTTLAENTININASQSGE